MPTSSYLVLRVQVVVCMLKAALQGLDLVVLAAHHLVKRSTTLVEVTLLFFLKLHQAVMKEGNMRMGREQVVERKRATRDNTKGKGG